MTHLRTFCQGGAAPICDELGRCGPGRPGGDEGEEGGRVKTCQRGRGRICSVRATSAVPLRDCRNLVDDDVLECNEKFTVRHRRSSESVVQQALKHQCLDYKHLSSSLIVPNLFSKLFVSLMNAPHNVVELLVVLCSVLFPHVADQRCTY